MSRRGGCAGGQSWPDTAAWSPEENTQLATAAETTKLLWTEYVAHYQDISIFLSFFLTFELIASFQHFSYLLWTTIRLLLPAHFLQRNPYYGIDSIDMVRHV